MRRLVLIVITVIAANCLGCEGNTTGMYHHKPNHEEKPADSAQQDAK